ncbi:MAG TPA: serine hydrolase [Clostridiaceae bacterium]
MSIENKLPRSTPEEQGIASCAITDFLEAVEKANLGLHSFMLLRHGFVVSEGWWTPYSEELPHMLFSLSKSFTSTAIGLAIEENLITLEDKVISFFKESLPEVMDENLVKMEVKHLLSMATGHEKDTTDAVIAQKDGDWVKAFLALKVEHTPSSPFVYNTAATYMLSAIIQKVTGQTLLEYLQPRIFVPLGIENPTWETCPKGINTGGFGLSIKTEDIAKFGKLYLDKGVYKGKTLIPKDWIEKATSKQVSNGTSLDSDWESGYGYQFWRCKVPNVYRADGAFGQLAVIMPDQDAILAITSGSGDVGGILNLIWDKLIPALSEGSLESNNEALSNLNSKLARLHISPPRFGVKSIEKTAIQSRIYKIEDNQLQIESMSFEFNEDTCNFKITDNRGTHEILCGIEAWVSNETDILLGSPKAYASGTWRDENTFIMSWLFVETPFCYTCTCSFSGRSLLVKVDTNVSLTPIDLLFKGTLL